MILSYIQVIVFSSCSYSTFLISLTLLAPVSSGQPPAPLLLCHICTHACLDSDLDTHTRENLVFCEPPNQYLLLFSCCLLNSSVAKSVSVEYLKGRVTTVTVWLVRAANSSQSWDDALATWSALMACDFSWDGSHRLI